MRFANLTRDASPARTDVALMKYLVDTNVVSELVAPAASKCGLYILTSEYRHGYLIYAAGWTTRPFARRMREHIRQYRKGTYTVLDAASLRRGFRKELRHGMWTKKDTNTPQIPIRLTTRWSQPTYVPKTDACLGCQADLE